MSQSRTPEARVFKARPRWRASSWPREHSALQAAQEKHTDSPLCHRRQRHFQLILSRDTDAGSGHREQCVRLRQDLPRSGMTGQPYHWDFLEKQLPITCIRYGM